MSANSAPALPKYDLGKGKHEGFAQARRQLAAEKGREPTSREILAHLEDGPSPTPATA